MFKNFKAYCLKICQTCQIWPRKGQPGNPGNEPQRRPHPSRFVHGHEGRDGDAGDCDRGEEPPGPLGGLGVRVHHAVVAVKEERAGVHHLEDDDELKGGRGVPAGCAVLYSGCVSKNLTLRILPVKKNSKNRFKTRK